MKRLLRFYDRSDDAWARGQVDATKGPLRVPRRGDDDLRDARSIKSCFRRQTFFTVTARLANGSREKNQPRDNLCGLQNSAIALKLVT